jgi:crotonobetainyl-CoA:carnitine CoA-transferase CaiB-like acyl-CoA transferase
MGSTLRSISARLGQRRTRRERVFLRRVYIPLSLPLPYPSTNPYLQVNRNKKSLGLSFQHTSGVEILHKLAKQADILVENYLPGTLSKYKLDYPTLKAINPRLIYASITGYGQTGPYSDRAGYDVMVEAEMGLMHITGSRDGPPVKVGVAVTDLTTGLYTSNSIMAAIIARGKSGRGQHIDIALSDCQVATLANLASSCLISGEKDQGRWGTAHRKLYLIPFIDSQIVIGIIINIFQRLLSRTEHTRRKMATSCSAAAMTVSSASSATVSNTQSGKQTPNSQSTNTG